MSIIIETLEYVIGANLSDLNKKMDQISQRFVKVGEKMGKVGKKLSLGVSLPILGLGAGAIKAAIDIESAFTGVQKTVEASTEELAELKKGILDMATKIPMAATELFGIAEAAGQLGIAKEDILPFTKVMADLGATTNLSADQAASSLAKFANITGLAADDYGKLGSTIVGLGNNMATTEADIIAMSMRLAGAGNTIGLTQDQILSLAAGLSSVGIEAEAGGTAFSQVMKKIDKEIGTGSEKMESFARISGLSVEQFEKKWKRDAAGAIVDFTEGLSRVQKEGENVNVILDDLGFKGIRISDSLLRAAGAGDVFREALTLGSEEWEKNTALTKEAELRYGTSASKLTILWNKVKQISASFGELLIPVLIQVIDELEPLLKWILNLSPQIKKWGIIIAGVAFVIGPLIVGIGFLVTAITAIGAPIALIIAGFVGALAIVVAFRKEITNFFLAAVNKLLGAFRRIKSAFGFGGSVPEVSVIEGNTQKQGEETISVSEESSINGRGSTVVNINQNVSRQDVSNIITESERQGNRG